MNPTAMLTGGNSGVIEIILSFFYPNRSSELSDQI
jgi:hypothetical protein